MRIVYDSSIVSFSDSTGFSVGDFFGSEFISFVKEEVSGSGDLGVLTFGGKSPGSSTVDVIPSELHFYDSDGNEVIIPDLEIENAIIAVQ